MTLKCPDRLLLLYGLVLLLLFGAAEAYFTDQARLSLRLSSARLSLKALDTSCSEKPEFLTRESEFLFSYTVQNQSDVAAYLPQQLQVFLNDTDVTESTLIQLEALSPVQSGKLAPDGSRQFSYRLRIPGADTLPSGTHTLHVVASVQAASEQDASSGFYSEPLRLRPLDFSGEQALLIPPRETQIRLRGDYTAGNQAFAEHWYLSDAAAPDIGDRMKWTAFHADEWLTIKEETPLFVRFELVSDAGTVRSDMYRFSFQNGKLNHSRFDYFTGTQK